MKILTQWLRTYVPGIPEDDHQLAGDLTLRGIAVEGVRDLGTGGFGKPNGHLFEMDITTNRVDAMNHYGIAREAATIYNVPLAPLDSATDTSIFVDGGAASGRSAPAAFPVRIADDATDLCGRFTAQVLRDITIAPSTGRVAEYFNLLDQKQISNAVDASNFVLLAMGHPTHAFDLDKIDGGIVVRLARKGEILRLLDGTERSLYTDDLVVADEVKPLALAGVMGGWDSMITLTTRNILVEAAWFDPASVRRSARRHGLHTDASHRFERGADFNAASIANRLVSRLILAGGGRPEGDLIDLLNPEIAAKTASRPPIRLAVKQVQRHLGSTLEDTSTRSDLTSNLILQYLTALGCTLTADAAPAHTKIKKSGMVNPLESSATATRLPMDKQERGMASSPAHFLVQLPSWRLDLEREIDLIEEVARVYGYNRFANTLPTPGIVIAHPTAAKEAAVRTRLLALGFSESISSTFASRQDANSFLQQAASSGDPGSTHLMHASLEGPRPPPYATPVPLENPLSEEASILRPSLVPGMIAMLAHNLNRDVKEIRLFEQGQIFTGTTVAGSAGIEAVQESAQLSLGFTTAKPRPTSLHSAPDAPVFELKGVIESLLSLFTLARGPSALSFTPEAPAWFEPGRSATALLNDQPIAQFGELAHSQRDARKLRQPVYLALIDLATMYSLSLRKVTAHDLSRFQAVERDFSFTFADTMQWHTIASSIHALSIPELQRLTPTEIFRDPKGQAVPRAHYAILLKCVFQSNERTLRDDELTSWWSDIISALTRLGGTIRAPGSTA